MAQQTINVGASPNDGTGDFVRDAFIKTNDNFTELYGAGGASVNPTSGIVPYNNAGVFEDSSITIGDYFGQKTYDFSTTNFNVLDPFGTLLLEINSSTGGVSIGHAASNGSSANNGFGSNSNTNKAIIGCGMSSPTAGVFKAESSSGIIRIGTNDGEQIGVSQNDGSMIIGYSLMNTTPPSDTATAAKWVNVVDGSGNAYKFPLYQ